MNRRGRKAKAPAMRTGSRLKLMLVQRAAADEVGGQQDKVRNPHTNHTIAAQSTQHKDIYVFKYGAYASRVLMQVIASEGTH